MLVVKNQWASQADQVVVAPLRLVRNLDLARLAAQLRQSSGRMLKTAWRNGNTEKFLA